MQGSMVRRRLISYCSSRKKKEFCLNDLTRREPWNGLFLAALDSLEPLCIYLNIIRFLHSLHFFVSTLDGPSDPYEPALWLIRQLRRPWPRRLARYPTLLTRPTLERSLWLSIVCFLLWLYHLCAFEHGRGSLLCAAFVGMIVCIWSDSATQIILTPSFRFNAYSSCMQRP